MPTDDSHPGRPRCDESIPLAVWEQIDKICDGFEQSWQAEESPQLEDHLPDDLPSNQRQALFVALLNVELDRRRAAGQEPTAQQYHQRFAKFRVQVDHCFDSAPEMIVPSTREQDKGLPAGITRRIGAYKLLQRIGEGGMGTVWMAEQETPVRRRVALKLIKGGLSNKRVIARFESERQALAMMDHPHIAKFLDAGTAADGSPFFVMELVHGIPINEYCDRHLMTPHERLRLFIPVCKAVQHAHQKGILHRDLKPSNVLVHIHDGQAVAKVIDFGLAKALQHSTKLTDKTMFTEFGQVVGTVQYMSPEQAMLDALDIDTRTDIYSLGVMLYELLAGSTPIDQETLRKNVLLQVLEMIREIDPPRPSHRLSSSGEQAHAISERRRITTSRLHQMLRGDLDWIIMKALEKDRSRRYESASDFAADIQRFMDGDAVQARPPSASYQVSKFVRKNSGIVVSAAAAIMLLLAGVCGTSYGFYWAVCEKRKSQALNAKFVQATHALEKATAENEDCWDKLRATKEFEELKGVALSAPSMIGD